MRLKYGRLVAALGLAVLAALASTSTPVSAASNTIWGASAIPLGPDSDASAVELGVRFRSDASGIITGIRFYKFAGNTGTHIGNLWSNTGALLARATFMAETGSGWQEVTFATPVAITANTIYVASYHTDVGRYAANGHYFVSGVDNAPLHALADGVGGANGVYRYGSTAFPSDTWNATNYWVDVAFTPNTASSDTTPPFVKTVTPAILATGVNPGTVVTATFSEMVSPATVNTATFELKDTFGNVVPATVMAGGETPTATLTPIGGLASSAGYIATVKGGASGVKDLAGNSMSGNFSWSFSTIGEAPPPPPPVSPIVCPCTVWNGTTAVGAMDSDSSAVELGMRFRSDVNGYMIGLRFYKHAGNTGTHIGSLWTNTGTRLTTVIFTNETASGWQQAMFVNPVVITANTTYVASYHTDAGHYAASSGYFTAPYDNAPLHALASGVDGASGLYRYGASAFPSDSYQAANYWVDVVLATNLSAPLQTPLSIVGVSPTGGSTGVSPTSIVTASISGFIDYPSVNASTFQLRDPAGNIVPALVGGGGETQTFTLQPTSPLAYQTTYTATVRGGPTGIQPRTTSGTFMGADYTWSFTTAAAPTTPPPVQCPCTIWNGASTTAAGPEADTSPVELGLRFRSDVDGFISAVRFYKHSTNTGTHVGNLWSNNGALLATATFTNESAGGWQQVVFSTPVAIKANTTYVASYHTNAGHYAANGGYFAAPFDSVPLHALADGVDGPSGVYRYSGASTFPADTWHSTNYWVDVVFAPVVSGPGDTTPPLVAMTSPAGGASSVAIGSWVTATFSENMNPSTVSTSTVELRTTLGALVPATVTYAVPNGTAILMPATALQNGVTYTATVKGGTADPRVKDLAGNAMTAVYSWSFTTEGAPAPPPPPPPDTVCPCSIWNASTTPAVIDTDTSAVEVGMRFRSDKIGYISALRFYKGASNTGLHVGNLWSNTGSLLARVTFSGESASGWQQMKLATPVPIAANTTYVVSYHTDAGHYAANGNYFGAAFDSAPLHAMRDGADGANGVYIYSSSTAFPTQTYNATNYWVDAVFDTVPPPDTTAPKVNSTVPAGGATGVSVTAPIGVIFTKMMASPTINTSTIVLRDAAGNVVPASVFLGGETPTVTIAPATALANGTTYTVTVKGTVTDLVGNPLGTDFFWSFTTLVAVAPPEGTGCPCTLWSEATTPPGADADANSISVGVKFRSNTAGLITALRFYKFVQNTGTHVGELWTAAGTRLAVVTFVNETNSGWQQVMLPTPVPIAANTTYVASYHTDVGRYAVSSQYFTSGVSRGPLRGLANGEDGGNGVYRYGSPGVMPNETYQGENYWVDVVFATTPSDTTAPIVTSVTPVVAAVAVPTTTTVTATFNEAMNAGTIGSSIFELRDPGGVVVPSTISYNATSRTATLVPASELEAATMYTAVIRGGLVDPRAKDVAGNSLATNATWLFTTAAAPSATDGPGGPILVVTSASNPYSRYYGEILRAEGLNEFAVKDLSTVTTLNAYDLVILGETPLTPAQATMFRTWANGGGNLIAMRPDKQLASLFGIIDLSSTMSDGYVRVDAGSAPGTGIVGDTIQFHGTADVYGLNGATSVASLYSAPLAATPNPAVTLKDAIGANGGYSAAFTYDLARSIVYMRQGNPAWAGQERDGFTPIRPNDLFFGASSTDGRPDWVDLDKVAIPQADEQQRLLVNLILHMNRIRKPLPRFWYLPNGHKAAVVMTGEDHVSGGTAGRFDDFNAASPTGCSVADWECVRATSYVFPETALDNATASIYNANGFEIGLQVGTGCANWTPASLRSRYLDRFNAFASAFPGVPAPATHRMECSAWTDYATQPQVEFERGMRLDTSYEYWPASWVGGRPGFFTGSGMPMRFVDGTGALIDVYQAAAQMSDDAGQGYPMTVDALLDSALGPEEYYGVFTAAMHTDEASSDTANMIVASAQTRGVPVISARQLLEWVDGRNGSSFKSLSWNGATLSFSVDIAGGATGLQVMLPTSIVTATHRLSSITLNGSPVAFTRRTIKGVEYAMFQVAAGAYQATYVP